MFFSVEGAIFGDVAVALFVAGALFGEVSVSLFVVGQYLVKLAWCWNVIFRGRHSIWWCCSVSFYGRWSFWQNLEWWPETVLRAFVTNVSHVFQPNHGCPFLWQVQYVAKHFMCLEPIHFPRAGVWGRRSMKRSRIIAAGSIPPRCPARAPERL